MCVYVTSSRFLYSGVLEAQAETLIEVGLLADKYQVEELQRTAPWLCFLFHSKMQCNQITLQLKYTI